MSRGLATDLHRAVQVLGWNMPYLQLRHQDHSHIAMKKEGRPGDSRLGVVRTDEGLAGIAALTMLAPGTCPWRPGG